MGVAERQNLLFACKKPRKHVCGGVQIAIFGKEYIMKKILSLILALLMICSLVTVFASCNKDEEPQKTFTVATNAPFEPFEYIGSDGKIYGIDMEIAAAFCAAKGYQLVIKNIDFDAILEQVSAGYADIGMAGLTINAKRQETNDFTDTYYNASQMIIVPKNDTRFDGCTTAAEVEAVLAGLAQGTKVGYQNGTTGNWYVAGSEDWGYDGFANVDPKGYDSALMAVQDMKNGNLSAVVVDEAPAKALVNANSDDVKVINIPLTEEQYAFAVKKGNSALVAEFNAFLAEIKANGTFDAIVAKYFEGTGTKVGYEISIGE